MAGKVRRKFIDIISDRFLEKYQGLVAEQELSVSMKELTDVIRKLDELKKKGMKQRSESLRKIKRLPLEKIQNFLNAEA